LLVLGSVLGHRFGQLAPFERPRARACRECLELGFDPDCMARAEPVEDEAAALLLRLD
jgi:hypothetical protein